MGVAYTHAFFVRSTGVALECPVFPSSTETATTSATAQPPPPAHASRRRNRGDASRPFNVRWAYPALLLEPFGTIGDDRGTQELTSHFPLTFTRSMRKSCDFTFEPCFGSSATWICASVG